MSKKIVFPLLILILFILGFAVSPLSATTEKDATGTTDTAADTTGNSGDTTAKSGGLVAVTFDDGPGNSTDELLDELKKRGVKVTFFIVGSRIEKYPDVIKREYEEGHELACHTWSHTNLTTLDAAGIQSEITQTKTAINNTVGADIGEMLVRPPGGSYNDTVKSSVGAPLILWSVDPKDWKYRDAETVKNNILANTEDGSIVLVHDLYETSVEGALAAIDELQNQGYTFVTVSELFRRKGITLADGEVYCEAPNDGVDLGPLPEETVTDEDGNNDSSDNNEEAEESPFPWGLLIFCIIILLINAAGLFRLFWGCKPKRKAMSDGNNEKNEKDAPDDGFDFDDDPDGRRDTDDYSVDQRSRHRDHNVNGRHRK